MCPQVYELMHDIVFENIVPTKEKNAWKSFEVVVEFSLANRNDDIYKEIIAIFGKLPCYGCEHVF